LKKIFLLIPIFISTIFALESVDEYINAGEYDEALFQLFTVAKNEKNFQCINGNCITKQDIQKRVDRIASTVETDFGKSVVQNFFAELSPEEQNLIPDSQPKIVKESSAVKKENKDFMKKKNPKTKFSFELNREVDYTIQNRRYHNFYQTEQLEASDIEVNEIRDSTYSTPSLFLSYKSDNGLGIGVNSFGQNELNSETSDNFYLNTIFVQYTFYNLTLGTAVSQIRTNDDDKTYQTLYFNYKFFIFNLRGLVSTEDYNVVALEIPIRKILGDDELRFDFGHKSTDEGFAKANYLHVFNLSENTKLNVEVGTQYTKNFDSLNDEVMFFLLPSITFYEAHQLSLILKKKGDISVIGANYKYIFN
jgi:hypothetical protein